MVAESDEKFQEIESFLRKVGQGIDINPQEIDKARESLSKLASLERKYKTNDTGLFQLLLSSKSDLDLLDSGTEKVESARKYLTELTVDLESLASKLSIERKKTAKKLVKQVEKELSELAIKEAKLDIAFTKKDFDAFGSETVEILISTNKGQKLKPLKQVASGGELSRIMLVLKKVLRDKAGINVLIFDEVDTGISGAVARAVGEKLKELAEQSQVICITHLAQVASLGDHHLLVQKISGKKTISHVKEIKGDDLLEEIARMISGYDVTKASLQSARELLQSK